MSKTKQSTFEHFRTKDMTTAYFLDTEARIKQAVELYQRHFRIIDEETYEVYSFDTTNPGPVYKLYVYKQSVWKCTCWAWHNGGNCKHAAVWRIANGYVKVKRKKDPVVPSKSSKKILVWMYRHGLDETCPITSRDLLNSFLEDGQMTKVQTLRARLTDLETRTHIPFIGHYRTKKPWLFFLTKEGKEYVKNHLLRGKVDPAGGL